MLNCKQTYFDIELTHVHVHKCERRIARPNNTVPMKSTFKCTNLIKEFLMHPKKRCSSFELTMQLVNLVNLRILHPHFTCNHYPIIIL